MFLRLLISVAMLTAVMRVAPAFAQSSDYEKAIAGILSNPQGAFGRIAARTDALGVLDQILIRFALEQQSSERDQVISALQDALLAAVPDDLDPAVKERIGTPPEFDGTAQSLFPTIILASVSGTAITHPDFYAIPCAVLRLEPAFLGALDPVFNGAGDEKIPRGGCVWGRGTQPKFPLAEISEFMEISYALIQSNSSEQLLDVVRKTRVLQSAMIRPETMPDRWPASGLPFENWSLVVPSRQQAFDRVSELGARTAELLTAYWRAEGVADPTATVYATRLLFELTYGVDCDGLVPENAIRAMVRGNASAAAFAALPSIPNAAILSKIRACGGASPSTPLLHTAVMRGDVLPILWARGYFTDIEARDQNGKTALMAAAERNGLRSVTWLIAQGADVNARTNLTGPAEVPKYGAQTALHYAASSASLEVITRLMAAGADPYNADDEGYRAVDYLTGWAQGGGNRVLPRADFVKAERMLGG